MPHRDWPSLSTVTGLQVGSEQACRDEAGLERDAPLARLAPDSNSSSLLHHLIWRSSTIIPKYKAPESNAMLSLRKTLRKLKRKELAPEVSSLPSQHSKESWNASDVDRTLETSSPAAFLAGSGTSHRTHEALWTFSSQQARVA